MESAEAFKDRVFKNATTEQVREAGLAALKELLSAPGLPDPTLIYLQGLAQRLIGHLADDPGHIHGATVNSLGIWPPRGCQGQNQTRADFMLIEFAAWMERGGFALGVDLTHAHAQRAWFITEAGRRLIANEDHPSRPGALRRLRDSCDQETHGDALDRLDDAVDCLQANLPRAAAILLGLAFEETIKVVLKANGKNPKLNAIDNQKELRKIIDSMSKGDAKEQAILALQVADIIRSRRNDGAHEVAGDWGYHEVEELLRDGIRAFPRLARLANQSSHHTPLPV